jgi:raffinose/stachyose/melibiose transport system substrate-binding protein
MSGKVRFKIVWIMTAIVALINLSACATSNKNYKMPNKNMAPKNVTIKFMSNLPDRTAGQGKIQQLLADKYMKEHPEVKIEFETLQDVAFRQKFKIYIASNNIPDIYMNWISELDFLEKISQEINVEDFSNYGFTPGALETRMRNGKLYGIPTNNDMYVLYYNRSIFEKYDVNIPNSFEELLQVTKEFRKKGIIPCAVNGKEKWVFSGMVTDLYYKLNPDVMQHKSNWDNAYYENDLYELKAAEYYKKLMDAKFFQDNFSSADYATAKDLFTQGKSAMYYMGNWELGMATDPNLTESFKKNLAAMNFPNIHEDNKEVKVLANWYGGGYSISKNSKVKDEAIEFLKYFFLPENWAQQVWDNGVCIAPQHLRLNGNENELMKSVYDILAKTEKFQGEFPVSRSAGTFSTETKDNIFEQLSLGILTPKQYTKAMDEGLSKGFKEEEQYKEHK